MIVALSGLFSYPFFFFFFFFFFNFRFRTSTITRWKQEVKRMCLNAVTCRETHQVKKVKELQYAHRSFSVLINKIIYYVDI